MTLADERDVAAAVVSALLTRGELVIHFHRRDICLDSSQRCLLGCD